MIQDPSKELTLIVYNTPKPPRYLKVNKGLIKSLLIVIPTLIISSISLSFLYSMYLKNKVNELRSSEPKIILDLKDQRDKLNSEIAKLKKTNFTLEQKISKGLGPETSTSVLGMMTTPLGFQDIRNKDLVRFENIEVDSTGSDIKLKFNLANNSSNNQKISGYISVVQFQDNITQFYPSYELPQKNLRMVYSQGESFGMVRSRPTVATFKKLSKVSSKYKIYIFSRTGDLISFKQIGPYNIE